MKTAMTPPTTSHKNWKKHATCLAPCFCRIHELTLFHHHHAHEALCRLSPEHCQLYTSSCNIKQDNFTATN